jgi:hypothetical protein
MVKRRLSRGFGLAFPVCGGIRGHPRAPEHQSVGRAAGERAAQFKKIGKNRDAEHAALAGIARLGRHLSEGAGLRGSAASLPRDWRGRALGTAFARPRVVAPPGYVDPRGRR